jgi:hypothetical protein
MRKEIHLVDTETGETLMSTPGLKLRKPHLVLKTSKGELGTVIFRNRSSSIDFQLGGQDFSLDHQSKEKTEIVHVSSNFRGQWRSKTCFRWFDFECLNTNSIPVARCSGRSSGMKNLGSIELFGEATSGPLMHEIVATVIGIAQSVPIVL